MSKDTSFNRIIMDDVKNHESEENQTSEKNDSTEKTPTEKKGDVTVALRLEREKRRTIEAELQSFKDAQVKAEEKRLAEQGKFEELYSKTREELETLKQSKTTLEEKLNAYDENTKARIESKINSLSQDDQDFAKQLLDGKDLVSQETILSSLITRFSKPKDINAGVKNASTTTPKDIKNPDLVEKYKKAKKDKDILAIAELGDKLYSQGVDVSNIS